MNSYTQSKPKNKHTMNWRQKITQTGLPQGLRICITSALVINAIVLLLGISYLVMRFTFSSVRFLDNLWFSKPWN